jgi:large subunit ribosomal protein L21
VSYAIIKTGGRQFPVEAGQTIKVPKISAEEGAKLDLEALVVGEGSGAAFGGKIPATVLRHGRGEKIIIFKKKRRKQYKRKKGHRQGFTELRIETF